jgi:hypothetical protein
VTKGQVIHLGFALGVGGEPMPVGTHGATRLSPRDPFLASDASFETCRRATANKRLELSRRQFKNILLV